MQKARVEVATERLARRQGAVARIVELRAELDRLVPEADKAIKKALAAEREAASAFKVAQHETQRAHSARSQIALGREQEIQKLANGLRAEPSPLIDSFLTRLVRGEEDHRQAERDRPKPRWGEYPENLDRAGRSSEVSVLRKRVADERKAAMDFKARLESFRSARVEVDGLRECAITDLELDAELRRIGQTVGMP